MPGDQSSTPCPSLEAAAAPVGRRMRWSLLNGLSALTASTVTFLAMSRLVSPDEYGRVAVLLATWGLVGSTNDWCGDLVMRFGPEELRQRRSLAVTLATRLVFAAPVVALLLAGLPLVLGVWRGWGLVPIALTLGYLIVFTAHNVLQWSAIAAQRFGVLTVVNVIIKSAPLVALAIAVGARLPVRAEVLLTATVGGMALGVAVLLGALRRALGLARPDRALLGRMWRYSLPALIGIPALAAISSLDPLLLNHWASRADVGRYQLAHPTFTVFAMLGASLNAVFSPELVHAHARKEGAVLTRYRLRQQPSFAVMCGMVAFGGACLAAPAVRLILPASYALTADLVALFCVAGGFLLGFWTLLPMVTATDNVWALQVSYGVQALANIALVVLLAPRHGAIGAALANTGGWAVAFTTLTLLLHRRIGARRIALFPLLGAGAMAALALACGLGTVARLLAGAALLAAAGPSLWRAYRATSA
jgi:O-antigen/teichoic acid export membrane protein